MALQHKFGSHSSATVDFRLYYSVLQPFKVEKQPSACVSHSTNGLFYREQETSFPFLAVSVIIHNIYIFLELTKHLHRTNLSHVREK